MERGESVTGSTLAEGHSTRDELGGPSPFRSPDFEALVATAVPGDPSPLLVFADDWGRHPSSCQHLVRRLRAHYPVLWVNSIGTRQVKADRVTFRRAVEKFRSWGRGVQQVDRQMWVVDLPMLPGVGNPAVKAVNRRLVSWRLAGILRQLRLADPILLTTLPYIATIVRDLPRRATVYYCTDDYSHWPSADRVALQAADHALTDAADAVLAVSHALVEQHKSSRRCVYFPHGVDHAHFASTRQPGIEIPDDLKALPGPRIGFFGLIYEKLDFELLTAVARQYSACSLVMIGSVVHCPESFAGLPNVHFLGAKPYAELPGYLAGLDVLLLPYLANDLMIRQSGPLKLRECLAAGKPTVSVDVPEVRVLEPHVRVGTDHAHFVEHVAAALEEAAGPDRGAARSQAVAEDDWDHRAADLQSLLVELASRSSRKFTD